MNDTVRDADNLRVEVELFAGGDEIGLPTERNNQRLIFEFFELNRRIVFAANVFGIHDHDERFIGQDEQFIGEVIDLSAGDCNFDKAAVEEFLNPCAFRLPNFERDIGISLAEFGD